MDSAIEISSGSSSSSGSGSDDEVSEPTRTRSNTSWLYGSRSFPQRGSSEVHTQASGSGAPSQPRASRASNVSGVDNEKLPSQQALKRTLPSSFNPPPAPSRSAHSVSHGSKADDASPAVGNKNPTQASRGGPPSYLPRDSTTFTRNDENVASSSVSGVNDKKLPAQQALKRTLPPSFNPSINGADYSSPAASALGNKNTFGEGYYRGAHAEIGIQRGVNGVRILPPSMTHGASASPLHYGGQSDPIHRVVGIVEDRNSENDERLIYQAALRDLNQSNNEMDLSPGTLSVSLMRHQKIALAWMFQKETSSLHCSGGILADDQGLGKTVSTIALILKQKFESQIKSEISSKQEAEILDLDADDESEAPKHESESDVKPEVKVSSNSETTVQSAGDNDGNGSSVKGKAKVEGASTLKREFNRKRPAAGTLIVCPASIVRQWATELDEKVSYESKLSVLIYHGGCRTKDPVELARYDVVVTTYAIVTNEVPKESLVEDDEDDEKDNKGLAPGFSNYKKRKDAAGTSKKSKKRGRKGMDDSSFDSDCGALSKVGWLRVVLDEAQTIKNHRTQVARACCTLRAKRRWCLSGTPIQNTIDDLYSYFRFLRYNPYAVYKSFYHTIKVPISRNSLNGYKKLQAVLRAIMLRRTKETLLDGQPIINLPPKKINLKRVDFSVEERSFYKKLEAESQSQFKAYQAAGTLSQNYANILLMLLRLRQACDHPQLVKGYNSDPVGKESREAVKRLPREARINLLKRLESLSAICNICNDPPENPVISLCGHVFCYQCVSEHINGDENVCPVRRCREDFGRDVVFSKSALRNSTTNDSGSSSSQNKSFSQKSEFSSSKIQAVLDILQSLSKQGRRNSAQHGRNPSSSQPHEDDDDVTIVEPTTLHSSSPSQGPIKTIVFSQWTGMLDLVEASFVENGIEFRRLDGTMSLAARDRAVKEFSKVPRVEVMLMSLKAGNLGLNMVAACHVILLDLWWNPTTEDQAVDRAHRIGQTRPVSVTRVTIKDTIEDKILSLQEDKRKMVASAFGEEHGGSSATRLTVDDLKHLFMA
ncbi:SNF2 domain-containing protein / helicase domain-containing protein / zinc finger protein-related [Raphanus sativus]|uniref:Helicase-like transcription factor CHR27 n=2 Tax=Raphanus sativus TaxID=3726 RepID=A0A9W3CYX1_RAPSA|nr:helicase-like transcription factor CHR27 [Raphanus sativus]KAJ4867336.1 SNF2 domain-containing protein / helicase domain-containing protein / zinc finger protein-related [Raphanus sativus]